MVSSCPWLPERGRWGAAATWLRGLLALTLALLVAGCSSGERARVLAGTNDALLVYEMAPDPSGATPAWPRVAAAVKERLAAAQIPAEVQAIRPRGRRLSGHQQARVGVVVDADMTEAVDSLVTWRGGLTAYRAADPTRTPLVELGLGAAAMVSIEPTLHGKALALRFAPGALAPLDRERRVNPSARIALAEGGSVLATLPVADVLATPLVLRFGDGVQSYTRSCRARRLLASPLLPALRRVSCARLPDRWGLAAACALLPLALSFAWLSFVRRFDRWRPEPAWLVIATFALGGAAIVPATLLEAGLSKLSPWLDPTVATLGGQAWALPLSVLVFSLTIGAVEEGMKFLGAWSLAAHRREFDEPVDGIIYACASALGFAAVENVKYFALGRMSGAVIAVRAFMTVPAHMFIGALWGYAMGRKLAAPQARIAPLFALAALMHGSFDAVLSTPDLQLAAPLIVLALAVAFVLLLERALRARAVRAPACATFRVGSTPAFYASAAGMVAAAFSLTVLGSAYELAHHRVGAPFVVLATLLLALLGVAAYGATASIPLDAVVDADGITFAGVYMRWSEMTGFHLRSRGARAAVRIHTRGGIVTLDPMRIESADALASIARQSIETSSMSKSSPASGGIDSPLPRDP